MLSKIDYRNSIYQGAPSYWEAPMDTEHGMQNN